MLFDALGWTAVPSARRCTPYPRSRVEGNLSRVGTLSVLDRKMDDERAFSRLHHEIVRSLIDSGVCPTNLELASRLQLDEKQLERLLRSLSDIHGLVLHPHECRPWIIHPFSLTPTSHWIEGLKSSWWAPCLWCAFGVAALVGGEVKVHTRFGAEGEPVMIPVRDGHFVGFDYVLVHFAIPPSRAWENVHEHCSMVLAFRSVEEIQNWCTRHRLPFGEPVPLQQVADLARQWYGSHANPDWRKWTINEAQEIFARADLSSAFWDLARKTGSF
jgi:hypothetical protein